MNTEITIYERTTSETDNMIKIRIISLSTKSRTLFIMITLFALFLILISSTDEHKIPSPSTPPSPFDAKSNPNPSQGSWSKVHGPITHDFDNWLQRNGYSDDDFAQRQFGLYGSYGGKENHNQKINFTPIVFIHGNEDGALAIPGQFTSGSSAQIEYFQSQGYTSAELYVTTWGERNGSYAYLNDHGCEMLTRLRRFIASVLEYTESRWVNIIGHSMGVTMGRKIVKGGLIEENDGDSCDLGSPLTDKVGVFIGIAGANYGLCLCQGENAQYKTCSKKNGFWPGDDCGSNHLICHSEHLDSGNLREPCTVRNYSSLLKAMNEDGIREGQLVYSFWTVDDDLLRNSALVWGRSTSIIPNSDDVFVLHLSHMEAKELTGGRQKYLLAPYETYQRLCSAKSTHIYLLIYFLIFLVIGFIKINSMLSSIFVY